MANRNQGTAATAYAADGSPVPAYVGGLNPAFAVATTADVVPGVNDGYSPALTGVWGGTPDPDRSGARTRIDRRANLRNPGAWWAKRDENTAQRHSVEQINATGITEQPHGSGRKIAPDPRSNPVEVDRLTATLSPSTWRFMRPFDQRFAQVLNGMHFSMASNKRVYEIGGQAPVSPRRNTYRAEPTPYDADIVDVAVDDRSAYAPQARYTSPPITTADQPTRSWRLM